MIKFIKNIFRRKEESNLIRHARKELELIKAFGEGDFYGGMTGNAVMELITVFSKQGHSGMSASIVRNLFNKLTDYKPLTPLTFKDEEWNECSCSHDLFQNNRNSAVFKEGKDGKPHFINAYYKKNQNGSSYHGSLDVGDGRTVGKCFIKDSSNMPEICIDIIDWEVNKEDKSKLEPGSGWWCHKMKDVKQLEELEKYYDVEYQETK